jgi:hypothetical protein
MLKLIFMQCLIYQNMLFSKTMKLLVAAKRFNVLSDLETYFKTIFSYIMPIRILITQFYD